jgi:hypothetical protein
MFGISTSIFNEAGGLVKGWLKNPLNASFFYWYFLPAVGFGLLQMFIILPVMGHAAPKVFSVEVDKSAGLADLILQILSASFLSLILLPLVFGVLLSALAGTVLRFYQGRLSITHFLFQPWLKRNQARSREFYGPLLNLRRQYLFAVSQGVRLTTTDSQEKAEQITEAEQALLVETLKAEIQALHERLETASTGHELPVDPDRVGPNALANALAVAEEYPFERYSMDTAVFWPRLSAEIEPEKLESMTASFGMMNGLLNLSVLSYLFAIECLIVSTGVIAGWLKPLPPLGSLIHPAWLFPAMLLAVVVGFATYRAAIGAARGVGNSLRTTFDYYRGNVLRRFNLKIPGDIEEERVVWLKLAAFIRRGETFYYPSEFRE